MNEKEFGELITRCLSGQATKEEVSLVEKWLDHRRNKDPFSRLSLPEKEEVRTKMFKDLSSKLSARGLALTKSRSRLRPTVIYRGAAAIIVICILSYAFLLSNSLLEPEKIIVHHYLSSVEISKKVILSDSTIVWLKGNSSILSPEKFSGMERNVTLTGEALFEVMKDRDHPFIIQCGSLTAKVLGTSFNVKSTGTDIEVLVLTGKVALSSKGNSKGLIVLANEKAVYNQAQNHIEKVVAQEKEKTAKIKGTEYSMRFHATRMNEIIQKIESKFDVIISVTDERLRSCTITADFTDQSLDRTLGMIAETLEIEYERNNKEVILRGAGCD